VRAPLCPGYASARNCGTATSGLHAVAHSRSPLLKTTGIRGSAEIFGEGCLSGQSLRLATAAAMTDCVIMRFDKAAIVRVLREEPKFSEMFLSYILVRNARVEADLVDQREAAGEVASSDGEFR